MSFRKVAHTDIMSIQSKDDKDRLFFN